MIWALLVRIELSTILWTWPFSRQFWVWSQSINLKVLNVTLFSWWSWWYLMSYTEINHNSTFRQQSKLKKICTEIPRGLYHTSLEIREWIFKDFVCIILENKVISPKVWGILKSDMPLGIPLQKCKICVIVSSIRQGLGT